MNANTSFEHNQTFTHVKIYREGKFFTKGVIVKQTTKGAYVYRPRTDPRDWSTGDSSPETAEWYPWESKMSTMEVAREVENRIHPAKSVRQKK